MAGISLELDDLLLDLENPTISKADSQRGAIQKIIEDQDVKLVVLAESIVSDRLNPMDRWLVIKITNRTWPVHRDRGKPAFGRYAHSEQSGRAQRPRSAIARQTPT